MNVITGTLALVETLDGMPVGAPAESFVVIKGGAVDNSVLGGSVLGGSVTGGGVVVGVVDGGQDAAEEEPDWQERALCAQTDPEAFFPEKGGSTREAKRICSGCDVRAECLDYALAHDERFGIWGGLSERERRRLRRPAM